MKKSFGKFIPLIAGTLAIVALDQATKMLVRTHIPLLDFLPLIDGFLNLTHLQNTGAAFSFLADVRSPWVGRMFAVVSLFAIGLIVYMYKEAAENERLLRCAFILILGGAAGNLIDRLTVGSVTDFVDMYVGAHHWPAYNVADSCISIGAVMAGVSWFFHSGGEENKAAE